MSRLLPRILATTAILSTLSVTAFAGNPMLKQADSNQDGLIQLSEFTALAGQKFAAIDADGNGLVTKEERKAHHEQKSELRAKAKFTKFDSNGDGSISETEFMAGRDARKEQAMERREEQAMERRDENGDDQRPNFDANGDGAIDLAEHQAAALDRFGRMDKDADGVLSADELRQLKGMRGKHKKQYGMRQ